MFERAFGALMDEGRSMGRTLDQRALRDMISESHAAMEAFLAGMSLQQKRGTHLVVRNYGAQITVELGWLDARACAVTWDRSTGAVDAPVIAFANAGFMFDRREYRCDPAEKSDR